MITIISASTGGNLKIAKQALALCQELEAESELLVLEDFNLPLYSSRVEESDGIPDKAVELTNKLKKSQGLIIAGPEYNGSIAPMLNNAIAWISRADEDWRAAFKNKFALIMSHSGGGGQKVVLAMKQQLEHIGCNTLARTFIANANKDINEKALKSSIKQLVKLAS